MASTSPTFKKSHQLHCVSEPVPLQGAGHLILRPLRGGRWQGQQNAVRSLHNANYLTQIVNRPSKNPEEFVGSAILCTTSLVVWLGFEPMTVLFHSLDSSHQNQAVAIRGFLPLSPPDTKLQDTHRFSSESPGCNFLQPQVPRQINPFCRCFPSPSPLPAVSPWPDPSTLKYQPPKD